MVSAAALYGLSGEGGTAPLVVEFIRCAMLAILEAACPTRVAPLRFSLMMAAARVP